MDKTQARKILEEALRKLVEVDFRSEQHFPLDIGERPLVFRLAHYLILGGAEEDGVLRVDCDYNRHREDVKRMLREKREDVRWVSGRTLEPKRFFPDIVLHERQCDDHNILVCEIKRLGDGRDPEVDRGRLAYLTSVGGDYGYQLGAFVLVDAASKQIEVSYYEDGMQRDTISILAPQAITEAASEAQPAFTGQSP